MLSRANNINMFININISAVTLLLITGILEEWVNVLEIGERGFDVVYTDLEKAFDLSHIVKSK